MFAFREGSLFENLPTGSTAATTHKDAKYTPGRENGFLAFLGITGWEPDLEDALATRVIVRFSKLRAEYIAAEIPRRIQCG